MAYQVRASQEELPEMMKTMTRQNGLLLDSKTIADFGSERATDEIIIEEVHAD